MFTVADSAAQKLWLNNGKVGLKGVEVAKHGNECGGIAFNRDISRLYFVEEGGAL